MMIFLEDSTELAERVQQTKLAGLGRLSASIAHEIRNPVGAISHAGQLLAESEKLGDEERRLTNIIHDHCSRVNSIIKNVLQFSRRDRTEPEQLDLARWLTGFVTEFAASVEVDAERFGVDVEADQLVVRMDPSHLHQALWNLCENALHHAAGSEGPVLALRAGRLPNSGRPFLEVLDRGPGIDEKYRDNVFEPFFTGAKDGTGLGLYIARELAECNRASLIYRPRDGGGSCFRIVFADPARWAI